MSAQEVEKALNYAFAFATTGAGTSFSIKVFIPLPGADTVPQTLIVKVMADQIAAIYGFQQLKGLTLFTGMLIGAGSGLKVASEAITYIPVAGPSTGAVTAFGLHMAVGVALIVVFELLQEGAIAETYLQSATVRDIGDLINVAAHALIDILRGNDRVETIRIAVESLKAQLATPAL